MSQKRTIALRIALAWMFVTAGSAQAQPGTVLSHLKISDAATLTVLSPCPSDLDADGVVGPTDLAMLLAAWGPCTDPDTCPADLNADTTINAIDLATLLAAWGECP